MVEQEVKLGPKTGLETVQNGEHAVVEAAPLDDSKQSLLVRVTPWSASECFFSMLLSSQIFPHIKHFSSGVEVGTEVSLLFTGVVCEDACENEIDDELADCLWEFI